MEEERKRDRRKNIVIKGMKKGEASLKEKIEEVMKMLELEKDRRNKENKGRQKEEREHDSGENRI